MAFSFFRFLGFGADGVRFLGFRGGKGVRFLGFRGGGGFVFWVSGETFQPRLGAGQELGNALAGAGGMHRGALHNLLLKE